jgi:hypothetical protein
MNDRMIRTPGVTGLTWKLVLAVLCAALLSTVPFYSAPPPSPAAVAPILGTAADFAALAGGALTCGSTIITGPAGTKNGPVTACLGPDVHNGDSMAVLAYSDFLAAYAATQFVACDALVPGTLAGLTLTPGVYCIDPSGKTAVLTLDGLGDPNAVWIFKSETSAISCTNFSVQMVNPPHPACEAPPPNVFWWSFASTTLVTSSFIGTILSGADISVTGGTITGRSLATGAVTFVAGPPGGPIICNCASLIMNPPILPTPIQGQFYSQTITASGGVGPYTYTVSAGILPAGLALTPVGPTLTGALLSGTPSVAAPYNFTIMATDSNGCAGTTQVFSGQVCPVISLSPAVLPAAILGSPYSQTVLASGGTMPYTYAVTFGALPTGLVLDPNTGLISGTPTAVGTYDFTITATDFNGCAVSRAYQGMKICPVITLSPATLPAGLVGSPYNQPITATGGTGPYTYSVTGSLPGGVTLVGGILSGTPTGGGTFNFTVTAIDATGCTGSRSYTIVISAYDVYIYDDYGRAFLCLNSANGDFSYTILRGWAAGSTFTGVAICATYNGVINFHTPYGLPDYMFGSYLQTYHKGKAAYTYRPLRVSSTAYDSNTLNNPPHCN